MLHRSVVLITLGLLFACESSVGAEPSAKPAQPPAKPAEGHAPLEAMPTASAQLGKPAPDFTLVDSDGNTHTLSQLKGKVVVLEWFNPDCPFIKFAHTSGPLREMAKRVTSDKLVWLSINSNAAGKQGHGAARNQSAKSEYGMVNPILLDELGKVGRAYGALKTPHMFVIDARGVLVYRGGLDNAPMGVVDDARPHLPQSKPGELVNYVELALEDLRNGRALRLADTPAYGCSVKYGA